MSEDPEVELSMAAGLLRTVALMGLFAAVVEAVAALIGTAEPPQLGFCSAWTLFWSLVLYAQYLRIKNAPNA